MRSKFKLTWTVGRSLRLVKRYYGPSWRIVHSLGNAKFDVVLDGRRLCLASKLQGCEELLPRRQVDYDKTGYWNQYQSTKMIVESLIT